MQTAYLRVLSNPQSLAVLEQPASWMCCIIRKLWIDEQHSSCNRLSAPLSDDHHMATDGTERALIARSILARVRTEMATLPEEQRAAIMLVCVNGLSYQGAAAELDIPIGTVMSRLCRGRLELIRRMSVTSWDTGADTPESGRTADRSIL